MTTKRQWKKLSDYWLKKNIRNTKNSFLLQRRLISVIRYLSKSKCIATGLQLYVFW